MEKTAIITAAIHDSFEKGIRAAIGAAYQPINIQVEGETVRLDLWDSAGQEKYTSLIPVYLRDTSAVIFVYSQNAPGSLESIDDWVQRVMNNFSEDDRPPFFLMENRTDNEDPIYSPQQGEEKARQHSMEFRSVNTKSVDKIDELIASIANAIYHRSRGHEGYTTSRRK